MPEGKGPYRLCVPLLVYRGNYTPSLSPLDSGRPEWTRTIDLFRVNSLNEL